MKYDTEQYKFPEVWVFEMASKDVITGIMREAHRADAQRDVDVGILTQGQMDAHMAELETRMEHAWSVMEKIDFDE